MQGSKASLGITEPGDGEIRAGKASLSSTPRDAADCFVILKRKGKSAFDDCYCNLEFME